MNKERGHARHVDTVEKPGHKKNKCWKKIDKCLRCGSPKHRIEDCPFDKEGERKPKVEPQENH